MSNPVDHQCGFHRHFGVGQNFKTWGFAKVCKRAKWCERRTLATLERSTAEQHAGLGDAPLFLIQTRTVTPSLYVLWDTLGTEVNLTGQPPSLYPDQTDRRTDTSSDTSGFCMCPRKDSGGYGVKSGRKCNSQLEFIIRVEDWNETQVSFFIFH